MFGPRKERNFHVKINKKAKQQALFMALSDKVAEKKMVIVDQFKTEPAKTKLIVASLNKLPLQKTVLLVASASSPELMRMVRNLPHVKLVGANSVGLLDVLAYRSILFLQDAVPVFERIYTNA